MLLMIPFIMQGIIITLDEYIFHIKRDLPKWERIGHPLDTLSVLICFCFALYMPFNPLTLKIYVGLSVFSALFVTKDEFVHKHHAPASEQWLHAILFLNHPVLLTAVGFIWALQSSAALPSFIHAMDGAHLLTFLKIQTGLVALFGIYQTVYWNFIRERRNAHQQ